MKNKTHLGSLFLTYIPLKVECISVPYSVLCAFYELFNGTL